jgi:molybdate transport system substrate-binding protein
MRTRKARLVALLCLGLAACVSLASCGKGKPGVSVPPPGGGGKLLVLCAAGIRPAMEELRGAFRKETGCTVAVNYAGSGTLLGQLQSGVEADLYVPGDVSFIRTAQRKGLVGAHSVLAWWVPVLAVQKGNPKKIAGLKHLAREDVAVGLGHPEACAIGGVSRDVLRAAGLARPVKLDYEAMTVNRLANQVKLKSLDAAVIWDATAAQYPDTIDAVALPDAHFHAVPLGAGIVKSTKHKALAERFAAFAASDAGAAIFRRHHHTVPGRTLRVGCGSSMRPAVEELAALFRREHGVEVKPNYGGSGTVLLQIQESKEGDVYICHDPYAYVCEKKKLSTAWHTIGYLKPVIAVRKGNPKKIKGFMDLLRKDVRLGLPHREMSTRGKIFWTILKKHKLVDRVKAHGFVEDRTHALVNKLKLDAVDLAILWDAPTRAMPDVEAVPIEKKYEVDAVTSATSGKTYRVDKIKVTAVRLAISKQPLLAAQFARMCVSAAGREVLARHRFTLPKEK